MPEGHTTHRIAQEHRSHFAGRPVAVSSPQGKFVGAARLDGRLLEDVEAFGKNLLYAFEGEQWVHVHLGLFGKIATRPAPPPSPGPMVRMRLANDQWYADLAGANRCALIDRDERAGLIDKLGPDPLRRRADPSVAYARISQSTRPIAALLMDQRVLAGVGNVFRAEILFRARLNPYLPGTKVTDEQWQAMWSDLRTLMRAGVRRGRIITTLPEDRDRRSGVARPSDATYVYGRTGEPCRICGTPVAMAELVGRRLYWCPRCQR